MLESVGTFLIQTNNGFLAAGRQGGLPHPYSRPIYSSFGTRDNYNAMFVPYFNSIDSRKLKNSKFFCCHADQNSRELTRFICAHADQNL
jgi:hypothetical protein